MCECTGRESQRNQSVGSPRGVTTAWLREGESTMWEPLLQKSKESCGKCTEARLSLEVQGPCPHLLVLWGPQQPWTNLLSLKLLTPISPTRSLTSAPLPHPCVGLGPFFIIEVVRLRPHKPSMTLL